MNPLPDLLRPNNLDEFIGQEHLLGEGRMLRSMICDDALSSAIFYGPPGTGKTTLAHIIAERTESEFVKINAVNAGVKDIRNAISTAKSNKDLNGSRTIVLADEIHRWQKNVQDALLPSVEDGTIILVGATTQNPYFALVPPLISRSHVFEFRPLGKKDLIKIVVRAIEYMRGARTPVTVSEAAVEYLTSVVAGDGRKMLMALEAAFRINHRVDEDVAIEVMPHKSVIYDRDETKYDLLSCIQGAIQASDVHGAVFWLARAINSGEALETICRRVLVSASEDVGCCNPMALVHTHAAVEASMKVGLPEASIILSSAVAYLAMNPRSKASCVAIGEALRIDRECHIEIPDYLKDCHYRAAGKLGRGEYKDGKNQSVYEPIIHDLFIPQNGEEIGLMEENKKYWDNR